MLKLNGLYKIDYMWIFVSDVDLKSARYLQMCRFQVDSNYLACAAKKQMARSMLKVLLKGWVNLKKKTASCVIGIIVYMAVA